MKYRAVKSASQINNILRVKSAQILQRTCLYLVLPVIWNWIRHPIFLFAKSDHPSLKAPHFQTLRWARSSSGTGCDVKKNAKAASPWLPPAMLSFLPAHGPLDRFKPWLAQKSKPFLLALTPTNPSVDGRPQQLPFPDIQTPTLPPNQPDPGLSQPDSSFSHYSDWLVAGNTWSKSVQSEWMAELLLGEDGLGLTWKDSEHHKTWVAASPGPDLKDKLPLSLEFSACLNQFIFTWKSACLGFFWLWNKMYWFKSQKLTLSEGIQRARPIPT